ncbi:MAG: hypothetical protein KDA68_08425 [Planctomycetaceae bacterium]|nr:hypothetical protein [Planctomycetaceae bacterium]
MLRTLLPICCVWVVLAGMSFGGEPKFAVGDQVEVHISPYKYKGEVTEVLPGGFYSVKYKLYGKELTRKFSERQVTEIGKPKAEEKGKPSEKEEKPKKKESPKEKPKEEPTGDSSKPKMSKEEAKGSSEKEEEDGAQGSLLDEMHEWEDSTGKFKVTAKFLELDSKRKELRLEQEDKQVVVIPLSKLSAGSRELGELLSGLKGDQPVRGIGSSRKKNGDVFRRSDEAPKDFLELDWSTSKTITAMKGSQFTYEPPESAPEGAIAKPGQYLLESSVRVPLGSLLSQRREMRRLFYSPGKEGGPKLFHVSGFVFPDTLQVIDLQTGEASPPKKIPENFDIFTASSDGEKLLATGSPSWRKDQFALIDHSGDELVIDRGWILNLPIAEGERPPSRGVEFHGARFIDDDHLQIDFPSHQSENHTILVDLEQGRVIYDLKYDGRDKSRVAHSADRQTFGAIVEGEACLFESLTGKQVGTIPQHPGKETEGPETNGRLAFSPSGKVLAIWRETSLQIWDLEKNQEVRFFELNREMSPQDSLCWIDEEYLLMDGGALFHKDSGTPIWGYFRTGSGYTPYRKHTHNAKAGEFVGGLFWYDLYSDDWKEHGLFAIRLPNESAIEQTPKSKPPEYLKLEAGTEVTVRVQSNYLPPEEQEQIRTSLIQNLKSKGIKTTDGSKLVFTANVIQGKPEEVTFVKRRVGLAGSGTEGEKETVRTISYTSAVTLTEDEKPRWSVKSNSGGWQPFVRLKEGETIQSVMDSDSKPDLDFFKRVEIPKEVERKPDYFGKILGQSRLTPKGAIQEAIQETPKEPEGTPNQIVPNFRLGR